MDEKKLSNDQKMAKASEIVRRCTKAAGNAEQAESPKREQIESMKQFASENHLWIDFQSLPTIFIDKGGENEVFYDGNNIIFKLNNFEYAGDDLCNFFVRIHAHNYFFGNVAYELIGFDYNSDHEFCAVLKQEYIQATREATEEEIESYMKALNFVKDYPDEYHNDTYIIFDAVPNNVLYGDDGTLYFIDTQIRLINNDLHPLQNPS